MLAASGQLIGVYSGVALEGAVSRPGERFHIHSQTATPPSPAMPPVAAWRQARC
jgi:hypothetical protein